MSQITQIPPAPPVGKARRIAGAAWWVAGLLLGVAAVAVRADEHDTLRQKWADMLTGGAGYNPADPTTAAAITSVTNTANSNWSSRCRGPAGSAARTLHRRSRVLGPRSGRQPHGGTLPRAMTSAPSRSLLRGTPE